MLKLPEWESRNVNELFYEMESIFKRFRLQM